jgi:hypothetical protein
MDDKHQARIMQDDKGNVRIKPALTTQEKPEKDDSVEDDHEATTSLQNERHSD